nr:peptide ABC transporter substrate-binding protein [Oceanipulchritudo coccoides]
MPFISLIAGSCLLLSFSGCARERLVEKAARDGLLLIGNGPEPQALDPHVTTGLPELAIQMALYEGLVSPHPESLEPLPAVAESWNQADDGMTVTFTLRKNAKWSDGKPVRAGDFVAAWERALNPTQGTPYAQMLYVIGGAEAYNRSETTDFSEVGVEAVSETQLEVRLSRPVPYFLSLLMHPVWYPIPSHLDTDDDASNRVGAWASAEGFVGNGPFILKEWLPAQYVEVERNPLYWDSTTVSLNGIRYYSIDEPGAEERAFQSGQLHVTDALPPARVPAYQREQSQVLRIDPILGTYYILPNVREGVLSDSRVRKALSLSINRKAISEKLLGAGQLPAYGFVPPNMPGYEATFTDEYDPARARQILAEAGYPGGEGFPALEYLLNSSESHRKIAEALQAMWQKQLGIEVQLVNQEWRTYLQRRASADFELARASWMGDYAEPSTFLDLWTADSGNNWAGWVNAEYDARMESAHESTDPASRMQLYADAEQVLLREQAIIPLYHYVTVYLKDPSLKGWSSNILDWHPVKYLSLEKAAQ